MSDNYFKGRYHVADGYVGGQRPQSFRVDEHELDDEMTDEQIVALYDEAADDHFQSHIFFPSVEREAEFIAWAREQINKRAADGDQS